MKERKYLKEYPELIKEWDWDKNSNLDPYKLTHSSRKKVWWKCKEDHSWCVNPADRISSNTKCPYCSGKRATETNNLKYLYPKLCNEWSNKNTKSPENYLPYSRKKVWWKCENDHEWEAVIGSRTNLNSGCPYCAGKKASCTNNFKISHPELLKEWDDSISPETITTNSSKLIKWKCEKGHVWQAKPTDRVQGGNGCPYCCFGGGAKRVCFETSLAGMFPNLLKEFSPKNNTPPDKILAFSRQKCIWKCELCNNEWVSKASARSCGIGNCEYCRSTIYEKYIYNFLKDCKINFIKEYAPKGLKYKKQLRFDFGIFIAEKLIAVIEFHGEYHFKEKYEDRPLEYMQLLDSIKKQWTIDNDIPFLEITYLETDIIEEKLTTFLKNLGFEL